MELLVSFFAGALGGNLGRGLRRDRLGFVLGSALGVVGGGLSGMMLSRSGLGGLAHAAAVNGAGIDLVALGLQAAICGLGGAFLVVFSGLIGPRRPE